MTLEFMRVTPDRVYLLEQEGWIAGAASLFNAGLGVEILMVREITPTDAAPPPAEKGTPP